MISAADYFDRQNLFRLIDVRAPIEFEAGHFPNSLNAPLLNDGEREAVGTTYKQSGQDAALELGYSLVRGENRDQKILRWKQAIETIQTAGQIPVLVCFRGGLRSQLVQKEIQQSLGLELSLIQGGMKALRTFGLELIEDFPNLRLAQKLICISGPTGSGKTDFLLAQTERSLDLENLANHRGSAFGLKLGTTQPSQVTFENRIAIRLHALEARADDFDHVYVEDESHTIGKLSIPKPIFAALRSAPLLVLEKPRRERAVDLIARYLIEDFSVQTTDLNDLKWKERLMGEALPFILNRLNLIQKKLGGARHHELTQKINHAFLTHSQTGDWRLHIEWVEQLLEWYYDPLYAKSTARFSLSNQYSVEARTEPAMPPQ